MSSPVKSKRGFFVSLLTVCLLSLLFSSVFWINAQSEIIVTEGSFVETVTFTVTRSGSTYSVKNGLTGYSTSSSNVSYLVNDVCIDSIVSYGGGEIYFTTNEYAFSAPIILPQSLDVVTGASRLLRLCGTGTLIGNADLASDLIYRVDSGITANYRIELLDLSLTANSQNDAYYLININDGLYARLDSIKPCWEGIRISNTSIVIMDNINVVDSTNEGIKLVDCSSYVSASNIYLDNCGGWGASNTNSSLHIDGCAKITVSNLMLVGSGGVSGGQGFGIYMYSVASAKITNLQIEGFESAAIKIDGGCYDTTITNFDIRDTSSGNGIELITTNGNNNNITFSNFYVDVGNQSNHGIVVYAENGYNNTNIITSQGHITDANVGISYFDDGMGGTSSNNILDTLTVTNSVYGVYEFADSDFNLIHLVNAYDTTSGILSVGANSVVDNCWNVSSFIVNSDDSSNYMLVDGSRTMTGNLNMTQNQVVDGVFHKGSTAPVSPVEGQWFYDTDDHSAYVYNGTAWDSVLGGGGAAGPQGIQGQVDGVDYDYIIFVNSTSTYLLNGTTGAIDGNSGDDENVFNWAIGNCSDLGYGTIFTKSGIYDISDPINLADNVALLGADRYSTILNLDDGTDNLLVLSDVTDCRIDGFTVQCNTATFSGSLIKLIDACQNNRISNMRVMRTSGTDGGVGLHLYVPTSGAGGGNGMFANSFDDFTFWDGYNTQSDGQELSCLVRLETHSGFINGNTFTNFWGFKQKFFHLWVAESDVSESYIINNHFDKCNYQADVDFSNNVVHYDCDVNDYNIGKNIFTNSYLADVASGNLTILMDSYTNYNLFFAIGGLGGTNRVDDNGVNNELIWSPSYFWGGDG